MYKIEKNIKPKGFFGTMRYENVNCIACGRTFTAEDDVVVCPICGAPHHRTCWLETGACAKNDEHASGYAWIFPAEVLQQRKAAEAAETVNPDETGIKLKNGENVVVCPTCGATNYQNDIYCLRCGMRLDGTQPYTETGAGDGDEYDEMDIRAIRSDFDRFGGISPEAPVDGIPCWEYAEYVGGAKPGRIIRRISTMERFGRKLSWNWAALLLGPIWFFWRKMKKEGAVISIIVLFLAGLFAVTQLNDATVKYYKKTIDLGKQIASGEISIADWREKLTESMAEYEEDLENSRSVAGELPNAVAEYLLLFGVPVICSLISIPLYRKKAKADIMGIRGKCDNMDDYVNTLRAEGGTSTGLCILGVILMLLALFCAVYLPIIIVAVFM